MNSEYTNPEVVCFPKQPIIQAVNEFSTPFFLYSEKRIRENCQNFKNAFQKYFPDFQPLYAVKANSNPEVLKIIIDEGIGFDASSETECWLGEKLGATGMFTGNYTTAETLKYAQDCGFTLNLDDLSMVDFLDEIGVPEFISFRINPGMGNATEESNVLGGPNSKYGVPFEDAAQCYKQAAAKGVKRFGIHMMTGSNVPIEDQDYFTEIVEKLLDIVAEVKKETGVEIEMMNIGGGLGVPYRPEEKSLDMERIARDIRAAMDRKCAEHGIKEPVLMAEPGRYLVADAGWLVGKVTVIKDGYKKYAGIDAASNDMPRPSIYDAYHYTSLIKFDGKSEKFGGDFEKISENFPSEEITIVGTICENNDQLAKDRLLPKVDIGDIVVIHNCGGHAFAMGHNYNGKLKHAEYLWRDDGSVVDSDLNSVSDSNSAGNFQIVKIREAQTIEDLYRGTSLG